MQQLLTRSDMRTCSRCGIDKPLTREYFQVDAQKTSGFRPDCKVCRHEIYATERPDARGLKARSLAIEGLKLCSACSVALPFSAFSVKRRSAVGVVEKCRQCAALSRKARRDADPEKFDAAAKAYKARNAEKVRNRAREYAAARRRNDPQFRLRGSITRLVGCFMKRRGASKAGHSFFLGIGYTPAQLCDHIERQFLSGMSWGNYGEWHVDHVVPNASFQYSSMDDDGFKACWALSNLRPMWAADNLKKGSKRLFLV